MEDPKNAYIRNFAAKLAKAHGEFWWDDIRPPKFTAEERFRGEQLVKTALYNIRRMLKRVSDEDGALVYLAIVAYFATPANLDEVINLGGFPYFWENTERTFRGYIMTTLKRIIGPNDLPVIKQFGDRLAKVVYEAPSDVSYDEKGNRKIITKLRPVLNRYDAEDFQPILDRATQLQMFG